VNGKLIFNKTGKLEGTRVFVSFAKQQNWGIKWDYAFKGV
jgi:hypothetical protein